MGKRVSRFRKGERSKDEREGGGFHIGDGTGYVNGDLLCEGVICAVVDASRGRTRMLLLRGCLVVYGLANNQVANPKSLFTNL